MRKGASPGGFNHHGPASSCLLPSSSTHGCPSTQPCQGTLREPVRSVLQMNSSKTSPLKG